MTLTYDWTKDFHVDKRLNHWPNHNNCLIIDLWNNTSYDHPLLNFVTYMLYPVIIWDDTTNKSINTKQMKENARAPSMNQDWKHHVAMFWLCCCCVWTLDEWLPAIAYISSCSRSICSKIHLFLSLSGTFFVGIQLHDLLYTLDFCTRNLYGYVVQCMCV